MPDTSIPCSRVGDVVKVPFPYTDRSTRQHRPALVVAAGHIEDAHGLLWVVMITSAENRRRVGDVAIDNLQSAGLPAPSVIRTAKIAMIESRDAVKLGRVAPAVYRRVARQLSRNLDIKNLAESR
jgi:mRNA interferase MazF